MKNWFNRTTGKPPIRWIETDYMGFTHPCIHPGRDFCFNCVKYIEVDEETRTKDTGVQKPSWWWRFMKTRLNQHDINFINGIQEKVFKKKYDYRFKRNPSKTSVSAL